MVFKEVVDVFIKYKKSYCSDKSVDYYYDCLYKYIIILDLSFFADIDYCLNHDNLLKFIELLRNEDITNNSINTYYRGIKVFYKYCYKNNILASDYTVGVKLPKVSNELKLPLSTKEVENINNIIDKGKNFLKLRNYLIFNLMLNCGLRLGEVVRLRLKDIDFEKKIIFVFNSKNNKSRFIPLPDVIYKDLYKYYCVRKLSDAGTDSLFLDKNMNAGITNGTVKNFMFKLKRKTNIDRLHAHLLRHTYATSFIYYYNNIEFLRALLGHEDYSVTKIYVQSATTCKLLNYDLYKVENI